MITMPTFQLLPTEGATKTPRNLYMIWLSPVATRFLRHQQPVAAVPALSNMLPRHIYCIH